MIVNKAIEGNEFAEKVFRGLKIVAKKLVEETAAQNGTLIIGNADGTIKEVPAKDLLHLVQEANTPPNALKGLYKHVTSYLFLLLEC